MYYVSGIVVPFYIHLVHIQVSPLLVEASSRLFAPGVWDPRFPLPTDPSASAFYYPTDGGVDDPTLLSSDDEAPNTNALAQYVSDILHM